MAEKIGEAEPEPGKVLAEQRARAILQETSDEWDSRPNGSSFLEKEFGSFRAVIRQKPELLYDKENRVVGVDAWVQLFNDKTGREIPIDPHRRIINPPTVPRAGISEVDDVDEQGKPIKRRILAADAKRAFYEAVRDSIESEPNPKGWRTRGTVTTVFAGTNDGNIFSYHASTYSNARQGTGGFVTDTTGTALRVGQASAGGFQQECYELFYSFDTSSIADSDIVSAVSLNLWPSSDSSVTDFTIEAYENNWGPTVTSADWVAGSSLGSQTLLASLSTIGLSTGAYASFVSQGAFLTATNMKTGTVSLMLGSSRQRIGNAPGVDEFVFFIMSDFTGTTEDPKLTITHNSLGSSPFFTSRPNRIWRLN
jgi:hypothetical protein